MWTLEEVSEFLASHTLQRYVKIFQENNVTGLKLSLCTEVRQIQQLGIDIEVDAMILQQEIFKTGIIYMPLYIYK